MGSSARTTKAEVLCSYSELGDLRLQKEAAPATGFPASASRESGQSEPSVLPAAAAGPSTAGDAGGLLHRDAVSSSYGHLQVYPPQLDSGFGAD